MQEGEPSDAMFLLLRGEASVRVAEKKTGTLIDVGRMRPGDTVGEMGILLKQPRTATVVAKGEVLVVAFAADAFFGMFAKIPHFGLAISQGLANRVFQTSRQVPLPEWDPNAAPPPPDVVGLLTIDFVQRHRVIPLEVKGSTLTLGFVDDPDPHTMASVKQTLPSMEVRPVRIGMKAFTELLQTRASLPGWTDNATPAADPRASKGQPPPPEWGTELGTKPVVADAGPRAAPKLDLLLKRMVAEGASDLHLSAGHRVRWRLDGEIHELKDTPLLGVREVYELLESAMDERTRATFESNDCDFAYPLPGVARFRVNLFRDNRGVGGVLRQIPDKILGFEQLGLPPAIGALCKHPKGLVLVTGPTGSGKSTTLAAMIDFINKNRHDHIITLEDPIEFVHQSQKCLVNQREVGPHTASFARALKAALREDPDIVLVGEMRDLETVSLALETANTGHLVFGTLHTSTAVSTIDRIIGLFPPEQQPQIRNVIADVLKGVVAQTLCRKVGGGRVAALEVLVTSFAVSNLIREGKNHQIASSMTTGKALGNQILNEELARLVTEKKVDYEEALAKAVDKTDLAKRCGKEPEKK